MRQLAMKTSSLWMNIGDIVVENQKIDYSVYQWAHFYGNCWISPQTPVLLR